MKTMLNRRRMGWIVLAGCALLALPPARASVRPLNTLVARAERPRGPMPAECEEGLAQTPVLRIDVSQIPIPESEPAPAQAPRSGDLRTALQETQAALVRNDRPSFDAALARERALLGSHPAGAERRAGEEVLRLHSAAARLWDAQYQAPFFAEDDAAYKVANAFSGYQEAVRRSVLTDASGHRFYPAAESRDFLTGLAAASLPRLGVHAPKPAPRAERPRQTTASGEKRAHTTKRATRANRTSASARPSQSSSKSSSASVSRPTATTSVPRPPKRDTPPVAAVPSPAVVPAATPERAPVPTTESATATESTATVPADSMTTSASSDTASSVDPAATTDTVGTATITDSVIATDTVPSEPPVKRDRPVILPMILILVGLGVLILLFRASK